MEKTLKEIHVEGEVRYRARILDVDSAPGTEEALRRQFQFLNEVASQPAVLACGVTMFHKMSMFHDGLRWVIELEAAVKAPQSI